ncbi:MAG: endonuclease VII [Candidatus Thermoplasmatota archaeon]|jgi:hypothetical protein|nr:endonuclease VII [Candidatus Thermoplasmatota archaeon]|tara:strand:+ start:892 stop:1116 length:225 start_codon:yes stop_codon:yes gene_type:complete
MEFDKELELEHLLFVNRQCRRCLRTFDLIDGFYHTRKDRGHIPSAYSYECKECTVKRVSKRRRKKVKEGEYPDW